MTPTPIIFDWIQPINRKARARRTDPSTSHDAAKRVELGKTDMQRAAIKGLLLTGRRLTVKEMAHYLPWPAHELGKRIDEVAGAMPTGEERDGARVWTLCNAIDAIAQ
jgi:hypothetical protein